MTGFNGISSKGSPVPAGAGVPLIWKTNLRRTCETAFVQGMSIFEAVKGLVYLAKGNQLETIWSGTLAQNRIKWEIPQTSSHYKPTRLDQLNPADVLKLAVRDKNPVRIENSACDPRIFKAEDRQIPKSMIFIPLQTDEGTVCFKFERKMDNPFTPADENKFADFYALFKKAEKENKTQKEENRLVILGGFPNLPVFIPVIIGDWGIQVIEKIILEYSNIISSKGIERIDIDFGDKKEKSHTIYHGWLKIKIQKPLQTIAGEKNQGYTTYLADDLQKIFERLS